MTSLPTPSNSCANLGGDVSVAGASSGWRPVLQMPGLGQHRSAAWDVICSGASAESPPG